MRGGKTAFVTGGTGFVGSHLAEALLAQGYTEVRCLVRNQLKWLDGLDIVPIEGDLFSTNALRRGADGADLVYHVAGLTRAQSWDAFERANVTGTLNLLEAVQEAAPHVEKVLVTSTLAVVGQSETPVADEETPLRPISQYGRSKAEMERALVDRDWYSYLPLVVVRPPAVYGPREADIFTFFQTVSRGLCPIMGNGQEPDLSLVHARDLATGMIRAAEAANTTGETYFLGSEHYYSWNQIKACTTRALGRKALTVPVPPAFAGVLGTVAEVTGKIFGKYPPLNREKAREIRYACKMCSIDKAHRDFGYQPCIPLDEGIAETIAWYRAHHWLD